MKLYSSTIRQHFTAYTFLLPALILLAIFAFYPILYSLFISFHQWRIIGQPSFVGLSNYKRALGQEEFWVALRNTTLFSFVTVPLGWVLALASALLLNQSLRGRTFFRGIIFCIFCIPIFNLFSSKYSN